MRVGVSRVPIERMAYIGRLLRHRRTFTTAAIADHFETSRKTIYRDLDFMRDRLGYEIAFDYSENSFVRGVAPKERVL